MKKEEQVPQIEGGLERLKKELDAMGKVSAEEIKAVAIFVLVLVLFVYSLLEVLVKHSEVGNSQP